MLSLKRRDMNCLMFTNKFLLCDCYTASSKILMIFCIWSLSSVNVLKGCTTGAKNPGETLSG